MQQPLFKMQLVDFEPDEPTAQLKKIGYDQAKNKYAVKRIEDGNWIPLTEWLGYSLCQKLGIATPDYIIGYDESNTPVFCSKWVDGKIFTKQDGQSEKGQQDILLEVLERYQEIFDIIQLDDIIDNPDRHAGNLIFLPNIPNVLAFDFSLAQITKHACNAVIDRAYKNHTDTMRKIILYYSSTDKLPLNKDKITNKFNKLTYDDFNEILTSIPEIWLQQAGIDCIIDYLQSKQSD